MLGYRFACKYYGIFPYNKEEEENLSDDEKLIRQSKIDIINACTEMRQLIDQLECRAKKAPENGDFDLSHHAALMRCWRSKLREVKSRLKEVATFGII